VIAAYRETSEMVGREEEGQGSVVDHQGEQPLPMSQPQSNVSSIPHPTLPIPAVYTDERPIGRYDFEGGGYVRIAAAGEHETEELLDMAETLIQLKRTELRRKNKAANGESRTLTVIPPNEK
jgi:hypothetical protein